MDHGKYDTNTEISPRMTSLFLHHLINQMIKIVSVIGQKIMAIPPRIKKPKSDSVKAVPAPAATLAAVATAGGIFGAGAGSCVGYSETYLAPVRDATSAVASCILLLRVVNVEDSSLFDLVLIQPIQFIIQIQVLREDSIHLGVLS